MNKVTAQRVSWTRQTQAFAKRHLQQLLRNKMILFLTIGWPILWYFLTMNFLTEVPPGTDPGPFKALTGLNYGLFGASTVTVALFAGGFARDLDSDWYRKLRSMPVSPTADLAGRFITGTLFGIISYIVTIAVVYLDGGTFPSLDVGTALILIATLLLFCVIMMAFAMVLALVVTKPEYMTTIAIVIVLLAYMITGFNGTTPGMLAENAEIVNYLPNSLVTRIQIGYWIGTANLDFMTPPVVPTSVEYLGLFASYAAILLVTSVIIMKRSAYGSE